MEEKKKQGGVNWTTVLIVLIVVGAVVFAFLFRNTDMSSLVSDSASVQPAAQLTPTSELEIPTQAPAPAAVVVENHIENNVVQNNALAPAAPVAPEKGTAMNPMTPDELVVWMKASGLTSVSYDGRGNGIIWKNIQINGKYADLSELENRWIGPVPFIDIQSCTSSGFQQIMRGGYCFSPFK